MRKCICSLFCKSPYFRRQYFLSAAVHLSWWRHFFFSFPSICSSFSYCPGDILYWVQGKMHFHYSLRNWKHFTLIVNPFPSWSTLCPCTDSHSNMQNLESRICPSPWWENFKPRVTLRTMILKDLIVKHSQVFRLTNDLFA